MKNLLRYLLQSQLLAGTLLFAQEPEHALPIEPIIAGIRANEANLNSVLIEGRYESQDCSPVGQVMAQRTDYTNTFMRAGELVKMVRVRKTVHSQDGDLETLFYTPKSTTWVYGENHLASIEPPEKPFPFPLYYGFVVRYLVDGQARISGIAASLEKRAHEGSLTFKVAPEDPSLILAEWTVDQIRGRYWVDPNRGYLVVKLVGETVLPKPWNRVLLLEETTVTPKQYGTQWYIADGVRKLYKEIGDNPATMTSYLAYKETFVVYRCDFQAHFSAGELQFSTNQFPQLDYLYDRIKKERLDVRTGEWIPFSE